MTYSTHYYDRFSHYLKLEPDDVPLFREITLKFRQFGTGRVLDVGCGLGYMLNWLRKDGWQGVGLDSAEPPLAEAVRLWPDLPFACGSAYDLPFCDNSFDAILAVAVIEHLDHPERMLSEMARVLRPGGMILISTPEVRSLYKKLMIHDKTHVHEFTKEEIVDLMSKYGTVADVLVSNAAGRLGRSLNHLLARLMPCDVLVEIRKASVP